MRQRGSGIGAKTSASDEHREHAGEPAEHERAAVEARTRPRTRPRRSSATPLCDEAEQRGAAEVEVAAQRARAGPRRSRPSGTRASSARRAARCPCRRSAAPRRRLSSSVSSARPSPSSRLKASPAWRCARSTVRRWTSALPTPSLGTLTASSCTITATANMPNAPGGISRASTTIEATSSSSVAIRASVTQRSPEAVVSVSSSFVLASLTGASNADPAPALPPRRASPAGRRALVRWSMTDATYLLERKRLLVAIVCGVPARGARRCPAQRRWRRPVDLRRGHQRARRHPGAVDRGPQGAPAGPEHAREAHRAARPHRRDAARARSRRRDRRHPEGPASRASGA